MAKPRRKRKRLSDVLSAERGEYFLSPSSGYTFIHSGSSVLDAVLGGGWPLSRVSNIVGDKSTGKTLLAIEAMANFARMFPKKVKARYAETEAAFDEGYAEAIGMPMDRVTRPKFVIDTVEDFYDDFLTYLGSCDQGGLYILDSLDAISDVAEVAATIDKPSYGAAKAKMLSQIFRRIIREIEDTNCHLMIISQTRANIGVAFGKQYSRSGGKALDFYASQVLYLAHKGEITQTKRKVKRTIGVNVKVKCTKNKIGLPFRQCEFPILFGYGVEDICASIDWLLFNKQTDKTRYTIDTLKGIRKAAIDSDLDDIEDVRAELSEAVAEGWKEVERSFLPARRKYG